MVVDHFDLPVYSCPNTSDKIKTSMEAHPASRRSPSPATSDNYQSPQTYPKSKLPGGGGQGKHRNAGILRSTNRVISTANESEHPEPTDGATGRPRLGRSGPAPLLQRPMPTANIPHIREKGAVDPQGSCPVEQRSFTTSADVNGLTITRTAALETEGDYEISQGTSHDKGQMISSVQDKAQLLASLPRRQQRKSPSRRPWSSQISSLASTSTEAVFPGNGDDEISMITLSEEAQLLNNISPDDDEAGFIDRRSTPRTLEAQQIVRQMSRPDLSSLTRIRAPSPGSLSGQITPSEDLDAESYIERPRNYRRGILSSILKLHDQQSGAHAYYNQVRGRCGRSRQSSTSDESARGMSLDGDTVWKANRPRKWYEKSPNRSSTSLSGSTKNSSPASMPKRSRSSGAIGGVARRFVKPRLEDEIRITVHIAELLSRQRYLIRLCRALMKYGAPTHRLEEYMRMTARVLEIEGSFLYIPGCMIISFDDSSTHTTEVKVVRSNQGIDLGKLADVHEIYKEVIHDVIGVEEATKRLEETMKQRSKFHILFLIFAHGCASASVGPFAFNARPVDMPVAFLLGCLLGVLQLILSPKSSLYSNVFEISAAVLTSFLARACGSIRFQGEPLFCFSAIAQAAIALILPGYIVLCASLELQSRSIVAGSVRMVYAIIYSLFLGFGITIGTAVYGLLDPQASTAYTCPPSPIKNEYLQRFPFVLIFTACLAIVNHAKWKQLPMMMVISLAGYVVSYFSSKRFYSNTQVSNALGAFVIGVMGNCYSRLRHGLAAAAMLPAIFVLVPSGLAASGSLISGITAAEQMTKNPYAVVANGTQGFVDAAKNMTAADARNQDYDVVFDIAYGMVQIAIGTTVGLFLAALVVYPLGKKRSGLFSF